MKHFDSSTYLKEVLGPYLDSPELPGLFERYCLETSDSDETAITARCKEVKQLWDMRVERPKYGALIRLLLERHGEAVLTLEDPTERRRAAAGAAEVENARVQAGERARNEWEALLSAALHQHDGLDPGVRASLVRAGESLRLDPVFVRQRLDAAPVAVVRAELTTAERKDIRKALAALAQDAGEPRSGLTLYHALGLPGITQDIAEIRRRHSILDADNNKRKRDNTRVIHETMLVIAKRILIDGDPRAYEESLVSDVQDELTADGLRAAVDDGAIDEMEAEHLARRGVELGLTPELAGRVVTQIARESGVPLRTAAPVDYIVCGTCSNVAARERAGERCDQCGAALFITCPKDDCATVNDASVGRCRKCGADLRQYATAMLKLAGLDGLLRAGYLQQAGDELMGIEQVLGSTPEVERLNQEVADAVKSAHAEWRAAEAAIGRRCLYAARQTLQNLRRTAGDVPGPEGIPPADRLAQVTEQLKLAEAAVIRARTASGEAREAIFVEALALAADCQEAREALDRLPASPTSGVRAAMSGAEVIITWQPSPTAGVGYEVTRVQSDGTRVQLAAAQPGCEAVDQTVASGVIARYEVVAVRGASRSSSATSAPLVVARELQQLLVFSGEREVRLTWSALSARGRVLITRKHERTNVEETLAADSTGITDRGLTNGERYTYLARVQYVGPSGEPVITGGTIVYGQPVARPEPVTIIAAEPSPQGVLISFSGPPSGTVTVLRCVERPGLAPGEQLDPLSLPSLGTVVPPDSCGARDPDPQPGSRWYLPVTVAGTMAVAGEPYQCVALPGVSNVRATDDGVAVRLTWSWPETLRAVLVVWRKDRQPEGPEDPAAEKRVFRLSEYKDRGGFTIDGRSGESIFVTVYPAARVGNDYHYGTAASREARAAVTRVRKTDVRYEVKRIGMRRKKIEIGVLEPGVGAVPEIIVVARVGDLLPRQPADGEIVARLGGSQPLTSTVDLDGRSRPLAIRAFLSGAGANASHRVLDPGVEDLVIR
ncbi:MAG TPA: hypothetical protein VGI76_11665 [Solirubrobacteraceae bacterium]